MTRLLTAIWSDTAATPEACGEMRRMLRLQVSRARLASGFPADDVIVAGKTGTLLNLRSEVGVVEMPDRRRYAVAVFTRSTTPSLADPAADAVIGTAARLAVERIRAHAPRRRRCHLHLDAARPPAGACPWAGWAVPTRWRRRCASCCRPAPPTWPGPRSTWPGGWVRGPERRPPRPRRSPRPEAAHELRRSRLPRAISVPRASRRWSQKWRKWSSQASTARRGAGSRV